MFVKTKYNQKNNIFYTISHIIIGTLIYFSKYYSNKYNILDKINKVILSYVILYQGFQHIFNVRIYLNKFIYKKGITLQHTINKISEHLFGYFC